LKFLFLNNGGKALRLEFSRVAEVLFDLVAACFGQLVMITLWETAVFSLKN